MKLKRLEFPSGKIGYFYDETCSQQAIDFRSHIFEQTQSSLWSVVFECFASHVYFLAEAANRSKPRIAIKSVSNCCGILVVEDDGKRYACFPDSAVEELQGLKRSDSSDVSVLNWFCYQTAKRAFLQVMADDMRLTELVLEVEQIERTMIGEIINKQHVIHYPRPLKPFSKDGADRSLYLKNKGVERLAISLA